MAKTELEFSLNTKSGLRVSEFMLRFQNILWSSGQQQFMIWKYRKVSYNQLHLPTYLATYAVVLLCQMMLKRTVCFSVKRVYNTSLFKVRHTLKGPLEFVSLLPFCAIGAFFGRWEKFIEVSDYAGYALMKSFQYWNQFVSTNWWKYFRDCHQSDGGSNKSKISCT